MGENSRRVDGRLRRWRSLIRHRLDDLRGRIPIVETAARVVERDRDAAGTLLGSALALRLFLFFVPFVLLVLGVFGLLGRHTGVDGVSSAAHLRGQLATELDRAFDQSALSAWLSLISGLIGTAWAGRSLTRALVLSSALSWRLGGGHRTPPKVVGAVVGVVIGSALIWTIEERIRSSAGAAVVSMSFIGIALIYAVLWSLLLLALPRDSPDPGASLPGAAAIAVVVTGLQVVSQLYAPGAIDDATSVYAVVAAAIAVLGWFFVIGRTLAFSFALNAVVYQRHGSLSGLVFGLPLLRQIPRRWGAFARFFDLQVATGGTDDHAASEPPEARH